MVLYRFFFLTFILFCLSCKPVKVGNKETLVASQNLLSDRILYLLGEKAMKQTVLVSALADSQRYSTVAGLWSDSVPRSDFLGESILRSKANLVFVTPYSNPNVVKLLKSSDLKVVTLPFLRGFDSFSESVDIIAKNVNLEKDGKRLIKKFEEMLSKYKKPKSSITVLSYVDGLTAGKNTFWDDSLSLTGYRNLAAEKGVIEYQPLTVEQLLRWSPDIIVINCDLDCKAAKEKFERLPGVKQIFKGTIKALSSKKLSVADDTVFDLLEEIQSW